MPHKFDAKNAEILDSPDRMEFLNPDAILGRLELGREMVLVDLGCGSGFFAIPAARRVKKVFALDVQQEMLGLLREKIEKQKITNIEAILSEESSIPLPDNSAEVLLMANVFHELDDRNSILKEGKRILSDDGRLVIIDWKKIEMEFGPPIEERFDEKDVISICKNNGFDFYVYSYAGPYNYMLIFEKSKNILGKEKNIEMLPSDRYFHGERKQYSDIDDLIKKTLEERKNRRQLQLGR